MVMNAEEELAEMKRLAKEARERQSKESKDDYVSPEVGSIRLEPITNPNSTWGLIDLEMDKEEVVCRSCRVDPKAREKNMSYPDWCLFCCANHQAKNNEYLPSYNVNRKMADRLELAARTKAFLDEVQSSPIPHGYMPGTSLDPLQVLMSFAEKMLGNHYNTRGESIMKAISNVGEVRIDPSLVKTICGQGRLKQVNVLLDSFYNAETKKTDFFYRLGCDFGNVLYKDFILKLIKEVGHESWVCQNLLVSSAEKCGDVVEMWLGFLDLCEQSSDSLEIRKISEAEAWYAGLEQALCVMASSSRNVATANNKRNKTPDSCIDESEKNSVDALLQIYRSHALYTIIPCKEKEMALVRAKEDAKMNAEMAGTFEFRLWSEVSPNCRYLYP